MRQDSGRSRNRYHLYGAKRPDGLYKNIISVNADLHSKNSSVVLVVSTQIILVFPQGADFEARALITGPGNLWGQGACFLGGTRPEANFEATAFPPVPLLFPTRVFRRTAEPGLQAQPPHFRSLRPGPRGGRSQGKAWLPLPSGPCPTSAALLSRQGPGAETGEGHPPGRCHMLLPRPQRPLQVPAPAAVPSAVPSAGPAAPPAARPWPPDVREGSGSPRKFQSSSPEPDSGPGLSARSSLCVIVFCLGRASGSLTSVGHT
ncbi:uncharacterized protein LOC144578241 [Callithrix jacchus]